MKRPMVFGAAASILCSFLCYNFTKYIIFIAALCSILILMFAFFRRFKVAVALLFSLAVVISASAELSKAESLKNIYGTELTVKFAAVENNKKYSKFNTIDVKCIGGDLPKNVRFTAIYNGKNSIDAGDVFTARIKLYSTANSEYRARNFSEGKYCGCRIIEFKSKDEIYNFYTAIQNIRDYIIDTLFDNVSFKNAATLSALTIGDKSYMDDDFLEFVKTSGVSHVMVVSGLHLAILMGGLYKLLDSIFYNKYLRFALSLGFVFIISAICGFTMSVIRSSIMFIIAAFAPIVNRDNDSLNTLGTTMCLILCFSPFALFSVALQLSVSATFGIIYIAPFFIKKLHFKLRNTFIVETAAVVINTLSATVATLPLTLWYFKYASLVAPITNLLITYAVTVALILSAVSILISLLNLQIINKIFFTVTDLVSSYINYIITKFGSLSFASLELSESSVIYTVLATVVFDALLLIYIYFYDKTGNPLKSNIIQLKEGS